MNFWMIEFTIEIRDESVEWKILRIWGYKSIRVVYWLDASKSAQRHFYDEEVISDIQFEYSEQ